jgi:hypothetical protein
MTAAPLRIISAVLGLLILCSRLSSPAPAGHVRRIGFSGYQWWVKSSSGRVGPGPNRFSDSIRNVFVDDGGRLHLKILQDRGQPWTCAEIVSVLSFGYGTYRFRIEQVGALNVNAVLGLFTWSDDPAYHHREIDVEISRWSDASKPNAQFVVQPYQTAGNLFRFEVAGSSRDSVHEFSWLEDAVRFESRASGALLERFVVNTGVPRSGGENVRINLWLNRGQPPAELHSIEMVIDSFEFVPSRAAVGAAGAGPVGRK